MFVHLYPADITELLAQYDGPPSVPNRPTLTWDDPEELYIGQDNTLTIPEDLEAGDYRMAVGLYDLTTFQRLLSEDGADFFTIPIRVAAAG
jgi:hypothetical protein